MERRPNCTDFCLCRPPPSFLLYKGTTRTKHPACKYNEKLFYLQGSSSLHVNSPLEPVYIEVGDPRGEVTYGVSPQLTCKRDQIKMRDYMDRRVTSPRSPPPPCKQLLRREGVRRAGATSQNFKNTPKRY